MTLSSEHTDTSATLKISTSIVSDFVEFCRVNQVTEVEARDFIDRELPYALAKARCRAGLPPEPKHLRRA